MVNGEPKERRAAVDELELRAWLLRAYETFAGREPGLCPPELLGHLSSDAPELDLARLDEFAVEFGERLRAIYSAYAHDRFAPPLLGCPESLIVFARLASDRFRLREAWPWPLTERDFRRLAITWGVPTGRPT